MILVLEVNSSPGLEGIEKVTQKDIAGEVIAFLEKQYLAKTGSRKRSNIKAGQKL